MENRNDEQLSGKSVLLVAVVVALLLMPVLAYLKGGIKAVPETTFSNPKAGSLKVQNKIKRKKRMVKIARGSIGQADVKDLSPDDNPACIDSFFFPGWPEGEDGFSVTQDLGTVASKYPPSPYDGEVGWNVAEGGLVTVPLTASPGIYTASFLEGGACPSGLGYPSESVWSHTYEFEVVCMTVKITATRTPPL